MYVPFSIRCLLEKSKRSRFPTASLHNAIQVKAPPDFVQHPLFVRAISASIIKEVRYFVTKSTGTEVSAVNVFVDSITID